MYFISTPTEEIILGCEFQNPHSESRNGNKAGQRHKTERNRLLGPRIEIRQGGQFFLVCLRLFFLILNILHAKKSLSRHTRMLDCHLGVLAAARSLPWVLGPHYEVPCRGRIVSIGRAPHRRTYATHGLGSVMSWVTQDFLVSSVLFTWQLLPFPRKIFLQH